MLLREAVDTPCLEAFKARLAGVLSNLMEQEIQGCWKEMVFTVPSNPSHSMVIYF